MGGTVQSGSVPVSWDCECPGTLGHSVPVCECPGTLSCRQHGIHYTHFSLLNARQQIGVDTRNISKTILIHVKDSLLWIRERCKKYQTVNFRSIKIFLSDIKIPKFYIVVQTWDGHHPPCSDTV